MVIAFFRKEKGIWSDCIHLLGQHAYLHKAYDSFSAFYASSLGVGVVIGFFRGEKGEWSAGLQRVRARPRYPTPASPSLFFLSAFGAVLSIFSVIFGSSLPSSD